MRILIILFITAFCVQNSYSQNYIGDKVEINKILLNAKNFSNYVVNSDYKMIGESYTNDAKIFPSKRNIIETKASILEYWTLPKDVSIIHHKIIPSEIQIVNDTAYDYGYYEGTTKTPDGEKVSWKGKYVIVWKKVSNQWKMYLDIWNSLN